MNLLVWLQRDEARPETQRVYQLRGGPVFEALNQWDDLRLYPGLPLNVHQPKASGIYVLPNANPADVLYADLALLVANPDLAKRAFDMGCKVIIDVHFSMYEPETMFAVTGDGQRDPELDARLQKQWLAPAQRRAAYAILAQSDAVVVGPGGRVPAFQTTQLPDVHTPQDAALFYRRLAVLTVDLLSTTKFRKRWNRMVCSPWAYFSSKKLADVVEIPDEN